MFKIRMLPAGYGDCLWVEYGDPAKPYRLLIDAGTLPTYKEIRARVEQDLPERDRRFDLFVVTHIDNDHIDAAVRLLNSPSLHVAYKQIWFNGWKQLVDKDVMGPHQGEYLTALIEQQEIPLNRSFRGRAAFVPDKGKLPRKKLPGGMTITLLAPTLGQLQRLRTEWKKALGPDAGNSKKALKKLATLPRYKDTLGPPKALDVKALADTPMKPDTATPNASSLVFIAEYDGKRCLFAADANPQTLEPAVDRLLQEEGHARLSLDGLKVPHHGSKHNVSSAFIQKLNCRKYLLSSSGQRFHHPDPEAVARIIRYGGPNAHLYFNYDSDQTRIWDARPLKSKHKYNVTIRRDQDPTLDIEL